MLEVTRLELGAQNNIIINGSTGSTIISYCMSL